jgi:hypothetical protein
MTPPAVDALTDEAVTLGTVPRADSREPSLWPSIAAAFSRPLRAEL